MSDYVRPPWGFSRDLLDIPWPSSIESFEVQGQSHDLRLYVLSDLAVLIIDGPLSDGEVVRAAWELAGRPEAFVVVWHSFQSWGDAYEAEEWEIDAKGGFVQGEMLDGSEIMYRIDDELG